MIYRLARVESVRDFGASQELSVRVCAAPEDGERFLPGELLRATSYPGQIGEVRVGDVVQIECSPLARRLGTGGGALVTALHSRLPGDVLPANGGHIMKARYSPAQVMVLAAEEQGSPYHELLARAESLLGMSVVAIDLHSQLPAVVAGVRATRPDARVVYVHTDAAALPVAFSRSVGELRRAGWVESVISAGQSYGGDVEAVNVFSALLVARHVLEADVAVVGQGPGNAGTGTPFGYSGLEVASILQFAARGDGRALPCLRISGADPRPRHLGVSHHSRTPLTRFAPAGLEVAVLEELLAGDVEESALGRQLSGGGAGSALPAGFGALVRAQLAELSECQRLVGVSSAGLWEALEASPCRLSTMGRSLREDPFVFLSGAATGRLAVS